MSILHHNNWAETGVTVVRDDNSKIDMTLLHGDTSTPTELHIALYTPEGQESGDASQELAFSLAEARHLRSVLNQVLSDTPEDAA